MEILNGFDLVQGHRNTKFDEIQNKIEETLMEYDQLSRLFNESSENLQKLDEKLNKINRLFEMEKETNAILNNTVVRNDQIIKERDSKIMELKEMLEIYFNYMNNMPNLSDENIRLNQILEEKSNELLRISCENLEKNYEIKIKTWNINSLEKSFEALKQENILVTINNAFEPIILIAKKGMKIIKI